VRAGHEASSDDAAKFFFGPGPGHEIASIWPQDPRTRIGHNDFTDDATSLACSDDLKELYCHPLPCLQGSAHDSSAGARAPSEAGIRNWNPITHVAKIEGLSCSNFDSFRAHRGLSRFHRDRGLGLRRWERRYLCGETADSSRPARVANRYRLGGAAGAGDASAAAETLASRRPKAER